MPEVLNMDTNKVIPLSDIWKDRKCIVCFLRHFNCRFCQQQISDLNQIFTYINTNYNNKLNDDQQNDKISIIAVGVSATINEAQNFKISNKYQGELYIDYISSKSAIEGNKSGNSNYSTTAPSYDILRLYDSKSNIYDSSGTSFRPEVAKLAQTALDKGFKDGDITNKPKQLFLRIGGMFILGPGNHCDYAYRSKYAGDHPLINNVLKAAIGSDIDDNKTSFVYPSTAKWVKDLKVNKISENASSQTNLRKKTMHTKDDDDAKYLQSIRNDQEKRFVQNNNQYGNYFLYLGLIIFVVSIVMGAYYDNTYTAHAFGMILVLIIIMILQYRKHNKTQKIYDVNYGTNVTLFTLNDIDEIALKMGDIKCDCGFVQEQDVSNKSENIKDVETRLRSISSPGKSSENSNSKNSDTSPKELKSFLKTCCYLREFLAKPHPLVGRKGPVCPFVPGSLRVNAMYLAVITTQKSQNLNSVFMEVENVARSFVERFHTLEPTKGRKAAYKAVVLIFPDIDLSDAHDIIDKVQLKLKPEFVSKGLMIGEFHRNNNACGLRNENFYPLRTPIPSLAIRCIVPTDLVFLSPSKYEPSLRVKFLKSYLNQFVDDKSRAAKQAVKEATELLKKAEKEVVDMCN
eukprot:93864_1